MKKTVTFAVASLCTASVFANSWSFFGGLGFADFENEVNYSFAEGDAGSFSVESTNLRYELGGSYASGKHSLTIKASALAEDDGADTEVFGVTGSEGVQDKNEVAITYGFNVGAGFTLSTGYYAGESEFQLPFPAVAGLEFKTTSDYSGYFLGGAYAARFTDWLYGYAQVGYLITQVEVTEDVIDDGVGEDTYNNDTDGDGTKFGLGFIFAVSTKDSLVLSYEAKSIEYEDSETDVFDFDYKETENSLTLQYKRTF